MTIVGRSQLDHPAFNTTGGSGLHASIETIYTNIGNDLGARYDTAASIANSAVTVIDHNFGIPFADLKINLYTGTHPNLVRVADPVASGWVIAATAGFLKTKIDVTAPSSGGPHTFAVLTMQSRGSEKLKDLDDINTSTPIDGQFLIYDTATSKWIPAYLKYKSETLTIAANTITPGTGANIQRITSGVGDLQMIATPIDGKVYFIVNETGADFLIKNDTGATAANRFYTGTGADITLKNQAAITAIYNSGLSRWVLAGGSGGGGLATELKSAAFTAAAGKHYLVDNVTTAFTATLPAGATGSVIRFSDNSRIWASKNLTIAPSSGQTIDGLAANETLVCDVTGAFVQIMWNGTKWIVDTNGFAASISSGSLSGGQGLGKKNYIGNANNATNWVTGGSSLTVTTETTPSNIPNQITQTTAIAFTRVSGTTGYAAYRFELDRSDYTKPFEINIDQKSAFTTEGYQIQAFAGSVFGTYGTQLTVSTAALSPLTGSHIARVDMPGSATPFIEFRIVATGSSGAAPFYANNVYFGPGVTSQGAAVGDIGSLTFTSNQTGGTTTITAKGSRVGDTLNAYVRMVQSASNGTLGTALTFTIPTGYTIDTTRVNGDSFIGLATHDTGAGTFNPAASVIYASSTTFVIRKQGATTNIIGTEMTTGAELHLNLRIPIAEFSGGTVNLGAGAQVEYASNSSSSTSASDTTSFAYGPGGNLIRAITSALQRTVRFQYPIQADDQISVEVSEDGLKWYDITNTFNNSGNSYNISPYVVQNTVDYGLGRITQVSSTDVKIQFGVASYPTGATYGAAGAGWSSAGNAYWRVKKCKPSSPVGFGLVSAANGAGLFPAANSSLDDVTSTRLGLKQYLHGTTYNSGIAPTVSCSQAGTSINRATFVPYQMQDSTWRLKFNINISFTAASIAALPAVNTVGVTFKNVSNHYQSVSASFGGVTTGSLTQARVDPNTNSSFITQTTGTSTNTVFISGDVELESKPTWAY